MPTETVYLDYAATTPLDPVVAAAMRDCAGNNGILANASSIHIEGRRAARLVDEARGSLAELLNTDPTRLIWTSGATESDNLAIQGAARFRAHRGRHLVTMPTEHKAVLESFRALEKQGFEVTWLRPGTDAWLSRRSTKRCGTTRSWSA
jgi:cysteine desulfurase